MRSILSKTGYASLMLFLSSMPASANLATAIDNPFALYDGPIEFDVFRGDTKVGKHQTIFQKTQDGVTVQSEMNLDVKLLFISVYSFSYQSQEQWDDSGLNALDVKVKDGDELNSVEVNKVEDNLVLRMNGSVSGQSPDPLLSSNHWNPNIRLNDEVINTLTGNINTFQLISRGQEKIEAKCIDLTANRYDYEGELRDTSVWYDDQGRWVKLQFKARDGSQITYRLDNCAKATQ